VVVIDVDILLSPTSSRERNRILKYN